MSEAHNVRGVARVSQWTSTSSSREDEIKKSGQNSGLHMLEDGDARDVSRSREMVTVISCSCKVDLGWSQCVWFCSYGRRTSRRRIGTGTGRRRANNALHLTLVVGRLALTQPRCYTVGCRVFARSRSRDPPLLSLLGLRISWLSLPALELGSGRVEIRFCSTLPSCGSAGLAMSSGFHCRRLRGVRGLGCPPAFFTPCHCCLQEMPMR